MTACADDCKRPTPFQAHCSVCHRTFGGVHGFDRHRKNGQCVPPETIGYVERDSVWREPMDHDKVAEFRARVAKEKAGNA